MKKFTVKLKRIYSPVSATDNFRILVDRLWPRGVSKQKAKIDLWLKDIAPSEQLRKWFSHDPTKWKEFVKRYRKEIHKNKDSVTTLRKKLNEHEVTTLVYSAKDEKHNNAVALKQILRL